MNPYQNMLLNQCMILLDRSKQVHHFEPMSMASTQSHYDDYTTWLMRCIEEDVMQRWEAEAHIWALQRTINKRIREVKETAKWKRPKAL